MGAAGGANGGGIGGGNRSVRGAGADGGGEAASAGAAGVWDGRGGAGDLEAEERRVATGGKGDVSRVGDYGDAGGAVYGGAVPLVGRDEGVVGGKKQKKKKKKNKKGREGAAGGRRGERGVWERGGGGGGWVDDAVGCGEDEDDVGEREGSGSGPGGRDMEG